jgi:hypothetical protein
VRHAARRQRRLAGAEAQALVADLKRDFTLQHIEPLFLIEMQMERGATVGEVGVLHDEEAARGVIGGDLEKDGAEAERMRFAEAIFAGGDDMESGGWWGGLSTGAVGKEFWQGCGEQSGIAQKRTSFHSADLLGGGGCMEVYRPRQIVANK